ncbi:tail fiber domain-containing protein [Sphingomonas sp. S2-65]|uniref:tail fiber domain-containing protein n=1 Tax=Sphingomonas sp. S2-65 TaxID=2903960 RepID=UPI001F3F0133|nr:tail fiber domain-containing protein [Sphingomonas sp. S2-65]UYY56939.1 tail fiber domain-containing protein [Sphingomonas sp. S2-65]
MPDLPRATRRSLLAALSAAPITSLAQTSNAPEDRTGITPSTRVLAAEPSSFRQAGDGAIGRTLVGKLQDVVSVEDYGAVGDGVSQDRPSFTKAAAALAQGGPIDIGSGDHLVGEQFFGPARGNVHAFDHAVIGRAEIIGNTSFVRNPASGWTLTNFRSDNPGISHSAGGSARAKCIVEVAAYTTYLISISLETTAVGGIAFLLNNVPLFNDDDVSFIRTGADTYQFVVFSYATAGAVPFELRSDNLWAGVVKSVSMIKVEREAPYDFLSIASDKKDFDAPFGIKFGRFLSGNIAIGDRLTSSLLSNKAAWNIALGPRALSTTIDGFENTAIGAFTLEYNQADRNTAGGYSAFRYNTKGDRNTGWGYKTFGRNSIGSNNTGVGFWASMYNQTGSDNSSFGALAAYYNSHGKFNSAFGSQAGFKNDGGTANTYVGAIAGPYTDGTTTFSYSYSTCLGAESRGYGDNTTAVGCQARCGSDPHAGGAAIDTAAVAFGFRAVAGKNNAVAIGGNALATEVSSTAIGDSASCIGAFGTSLGFGTKATEKSVTVGAEAGGNLVGTSNVSLGYRANCFAAPTKRSNVVAIGAGASCNADDQVTIGNAGVQQIRAAVATITTPSDRRDQKNIKRIDPNFACGIVAALTPARWEWNMRDGHERGGVETGFIAQDLVAVQNAKDAAWLGLVSSTDPDRLEVSSGKLLPILAAALQDALKRIEVLEAERR